MGFERARDNVFKTGDGSQWCLVDQEMLLALTEEMKGALLDPIKTTVVLDRRCMTTWVMKKPRIEGLQELA